MIILLALGLWVGYNVPLTQIHGECERGYKSACRVEQKINHYVDKK